MEKILQKTDHFYNLMNLLFLGSVSLLPFPSRAFADHVHGDANSQTATSLYVMCVLVPSLLWTLKWFYAVNARLVDPRIVDSYLEQGKKIYVATSFGLAAAVAVTFADWRTGITLAGLITSVYLLPPRAPDYKPGQQPKDEIEEAEEAR